MMIPRFKAVSQILWPDKDREVWFSLGENHEMARRFPDLPQHGTRGEKRCAAFFAESRMQFGDPTKIHGKSGFGLHHLRNCFMAVALCVLGPLTCAAEGGGINGDATYISFSVPGALGTYPMSINASMAVTGYYYVSSTVTRGFLRDADGTITTFDVAGGVWTEPESINAAGNITGFYELAAEVPQGFLRYADGHIITIELPPFSGVLMAAKPVSISDFDDIAGNYQFGSFYAFTRSAGGVYKSAQFGHGTVATSINASGALVGYSNFADTGGDFGFVVHPDGYTDTFTVPLPPQPDPPCIGATFPDGINAAGMIAGWYVNECNTGDTGGFVMSPDGVFTLFQPPGTILASSSPELEGNSLTVPHWISIDQAGDITGSYMDPAEVQHGFVRNPYGTISSFDPPEGKETTATSINDGGAIAGFYQYNSGGGPSVGFIRVP